MSWLLRTVQQDPRGALSTKMLTLILRKRVSIFGFTFSKFVFGGITPFSRTMIALTSPASAAAPSRWPILDLRAPLSLVVSLSVMRLVRPQGHSHVKGIPDRAVLPEAAPYCLRLTRVPNRRARAVRLEEPCVLHREACPAVSVVYQVFLGLPARLRDAGGFAIFVGAGSTDDSPDGITIADCVRELLEDHHADALATGVAIGAVVEGVAPAARGQKVYVREPGVRLWRDSEVAPGKYGLLEELRHVSPFERGSAIPTVLQAPLFND